MSSGGASLALALAPAILAGVFGAGALWLGSGPGVAIGFAVFGALLALALRPHGSPEAEAATARTADDRAKPPSDVSQALLDALPFGVLVVGRDRTVRRANARAQTYLGTRGNLGADGLHVSMLRTRRLLEGIDAALDTREPATISFQQSRTSDVYLKAHFAPVGETGDILVAIEDETHARRARETHRDFVANASHELKTPMAAVNGIIDTLLGHARTDPTATERFLHLLAGQTERMTRLIQDLLSLNRVELNERVAPETPEDLVSAVSEVVDALRPVAEVAGVTLNFTEPGQRIVVKADRDELGQLFQNLVDNAIKYGGDGTVVTIGIHDDRPPGPDMIAVSVEDQGPGIARQDIPRVTERFYRVNTKGAQARSGTGLGLAICQHIVNRHRGRLEITSRVGEGSRFTVWLPVSARLKGLDRQMPEAAEVGPDAAA